MLKNDNDTEKGARRGENPLDKAKKLNFKILRSRDHDSHLLFAVHKLNTSCNLLLAAQNKDNCRP